MAFLDNSGDIILDAVLTDTGRLRLAQGNGNFKISYFTFGDDEINYGLYNKNHPSGSAYYDLDILQTPVFEAFTNNASTMKYQLISNSNTQLLYLPVLKLNTSSESGTAFYSGLNTFLVTTSTATSFFTASSPAGVLYGNLEGSKNICLDQGIDNSEVGTRVSVGGVNGFDQSLEETQYTVELNNNFVELYNVSNAPVPVSFIDDDGMATYTLSYNVDATANDLVSQIEIPSDSGITLISPIAGALDKRIKFKLKVKPDLNTNNSLFTRFGGTTTINGTNFYYIDSFVTVKGVTIGTQLTVPIKIIKY